MIAHRAERRFTMTEFEQVLVNRDRMTKEEAKAERRRAKEAFYELMAEGASYDDIEDMMLGDYGLEMDYITDII